MAVYQVLMAPTETYAGAFVPDRFSWSAAILTPLWAVMHGLWLELVIWIACALVLIVVTPLMGGEAAVWLYMAGALLVGFEAPSIRTANLVRRGYRLEGDLIAASPEDAERDFLLRKGPAL